MPFMCRAGCESKHDFRRHVTTAQPYLFLVVRHVVFFGFYGVADYGRAAPPIIEPFAFLADVKPLLLDGWMHVEVEHILLFV